MIGTRYLLNVGNSLIKNILGGNEMKKILGLESFSELKEVFGDIYCRVLWSAVGTSFVLAIIGKCYDALYSTAIELFVFTSMFAVMGTISSRHIENKVDKHLKSLPNDEKDLLIYIYEHSKKSTNAVYVPYDNAVAISLKYKRILRRYDTVPTRIARKKNSKHNKYCFLYGIRKRPQDYIEDKRGQFNNFPSAELCEYLDKYQYIDEDKIRYIAYGSNLSVEQMARRCPNAKIVETTVLKDWKLVFRKHANIEPCEGSEVPVLIWEISEADEKRLDRYEGVPKSYVKKYLPEGMVYVMAKKREIKVPQQEYLDKIKSGYEKFGFNKEILSKAVNEAQKMSS